MTALFTVIAVSALVWGLAWLVAWAANKGARDGRNGVIVDAQAKALRDLQERNELERNTPVSGAARRLQDSPWTRD